MKKVLLQGTFEMINWKHVKALQLAKQRGDYLIVALNSNKLLKQYKNRLAVFPWKQKKFILESLRFVDKVVMAPEFSCLKLLRKYDIDVYVITQEWRKYKKMEFDYMKKKGGKVVVSPKFKGALSTSDIKRILLKEAQNGNK